MMNDGSGAGRDARTRARFRVGALITIVRINTRCCDG